MTEALVMNCLLYNTGLVWYSLILSLTINYFNTTTLAGNGAAQEIDEMEAFTGHGIPFSSLLIVFL